MGTLTHDTTLEEYLRVIEVNQIGVFLGMRAAIPAMLANRRGSIVNISSTAGLLGIPGAVAYNASKFAVRGMTKCAALEYGHSGIRVNSIHPGLIDTPMTRPILDEVGDTYATFAMPRAAQPQEVANLALFLAVRRIQLLHRRRVPRRRGPRSRNREPHRPGVGAMIPSGRTPERRGRHARRPGGRVSATYLVASRPAGRTG